ncbi:MAG: pyruvate kinase [Chloroflexota bacterium]
MNKTYVPTKQTRIVCTIGPASSSQPVLEQMLINGMDIARINFAHGSLDSHREVIQNIRSAAATVGRRVAIFGDLPGPKMRIGTLKAKSIQLKRDQPFILQTEEILGDEGRVSTSFERLPQVVKPGDSIFLNDGFMRLQVEQILGEQVHTTVKIGGELRSNKGINIPDVDLGIRAFTDFDHDALKFAAEQQLDGVSQSFVESAADIHAVREAARALDYDPFIIAKIERSGAIENISEILEATDGIMVARGDLGVEIPIERVSIVQKELISAANLLGIPVITATHMLESMITNIRPTRAEVIDVSNAILDGTDCVMLSGETAIGNHPEQVVALMSRIARVTEESRPDIGVGDFLRLRQTEDDISTFDLISYQVFDTDIRSRFLSNPRNA